MNRVELEEIIKKGESLTVEFKSWIKASSMRERISLAVDELVAFANTKGGTVFFGVEDSGEITGCTKYDCQSLMEAIYDKTRPPLFVEIQEIEYEKEMILAISVESDGIMHATTDGKCLKRLGKIQNLIILKKWAIGILWHKIRIFQDVWWWRVQWRILIFWNCTV